MPFTTTVDHPEKFSLHHHHLLRVTKDVSYILNEINECKAAADEVNRSKVNMSPNW